MLIGCITGPDFETAKMQLDLAKKYCDGVEIRRDLLEVPIEADGFVIHTDQNDMQLPDGKTMSCYHNFDETPGDLQSVLDGLPHADFYKISCLANSITDSLRMLAFVRNKPNVSGMCMGPFGHITRILGPVFENPFTFSALGPEAAPSQVQAQELVETYRFHRLGPATKIYGLIGNPVSQSPSHITHNAYLAETDAVYIKMLLEMEELYLFFELMKELPFHGLSVTIPFKERVQPYLDEITEEAEAIGAVNTITFGEVALGSNTDGVGALDAIGEVSGKRVVILGAGGSSKAIEFEAKKRGAQVTILSRRFGNLDHVSEYDILINTTPVECPIALEKLLPNKVVMDINVTHAESPFMLHAQKLGCRLVYGMDMFKRQALGQFNTWKLKSDQILSL